MKKDKRKYPELNYRDELYKILTAPSTRIDADLNSVDKEVFKYLFLEDELNEDELIKKILGDD